ncbi:MAG: hypothetical protein HRU19_08865 [Pseudobacteriovorax sp.]|nr:hypothetical protein [Pseudobacteriovorax sp.]
MQNKFQMSEILHYFDAQAKDCIDSNGSSSRNRAVLALRDRLLILPDIEFKVAMKTVNGLLDQNAKDEEPKETARTSDYLDQSTAIRLYESKGSDLNATGKIDSI